MPIVTLTTDFGTADGYVGAMKGVILSIGPDVRLVDITHDLPPHDVRRGAFVLLSVIPYFPPDTVHLAVVDPGVGTERRAIAVATAHGFLVGPDNGLFTYVLAEAGEWTAVELAGGRYALPQVSSTFHGRDLFAPAAAHLATGLPLERLGPHVSDPMFLPLPRLQAAEGAIEGEVLYVDRFGNVVTSIGRLRWEGRMLGLEPAFGADVPLLRIAASKAEVSVGGAVLRGIRRAYGEVAPGEPVAVVGSVGFLEVAVREGNAARRLQVAPGEPVTVRL